MTKKEFKDFCSTTEPGTTMTFTLMDREVQGTFIGCADNELVIESNGMDFFWPHELCSCQENSYPSPSYR